MAHKNRYYDASKAHHTPEGFRNPQQTQTRGKGDFRRWQEERKQQGLPKPPEQGYARFIADWWQQPDFSGSEDAAWWLGHACILFRVQGRYILTDPALSKRASPLAFYGPRRKTPVAADVDQLPPVDVVLLSHNHYDHLDKQTVKKLLKRFPGVTFLVPLGMKTWLTRRGARQVEELDWWDVQHHAGLAFHCVPAQHWSMRTLWDRNRSLWCGWVVTHPSLRLYFSGDSGYTPLLHQIGERLGPFDLAALPIGAYAPRWFMGPQHMGPQQSAQLFKQLNCRRAIPIHWGVFELADESLDEPPRILQQAISAENISDQAFCALKIGGRINLSLPVTSPSPQQ